MKYSLLLIFSLSYLISFSQSLTSETEFKNYFNKNLSSLDPIEGIWSVSGVFKEYYYDKLQTTSSVENVLTKAIMKNANNDYQVYFFDEAISDSTVTFTKTSIAGVYLRYGKVKNKVINSSNAYITADNILQYTYTYSYDEAVELKRESYKQINMNVTEAQLKKECLNLKVCIEYTLIKIYPTISESEKAEKSTGTGFAISSNGYIATCNHVVDGAETIKVKGVGGDFTKSYSATIISTDANNDLAIIKINDVSVTTLGIIPYTISSSSSDVGSSIFILGYPLTATMGDEIKLTNGVISAKSGFKGDITSYQITAAAQPGNSGGPLFDKYGNLIGVVNAKYVAAESATYAVKSTYLKNLIDALPTTITLPTASSLTWKALTEQVKAIKNFVYIIEVN